MVKAYVAWHALTPSAYPFIPLHTPTYAPVYPVVELNAPTHAFIPPPYASPLHAHDQGAVVPLVVLVVTGVVVVVLVTGKPPFGHGFSLVEGRKATGPLNLPQDPDANRSAPPIPHVPHEPPDKAPHHPTEPRLWRAEEVVRGRADVRE